MPWIPQYGNQELAFAARHIDELFYGGERGGGKSDFQLGYQEDAALRYEGKSRGIMFRKTYAELEELQSRAVEIFSASGAIYKSQPSANFPFSNCWYWNNGASVKMRYIENERDYTRYHGHQYCVGVDTEILMADGGYKRISDISVGDDVMTLEGSKKVTDKITPYIAPCVKLTTKKGWQIQPVWHPVLSNVLPLYESQNDGLKTPAQLQNSWTSAESLLYDRHKNLDSVSSTIDGQNYYKGIEGELREFERLGGYSFQAMLVSQVLHSIDHPSILKAKQHRDHDIFYGLFGEKYRLNNSWLKEGLSRLRELFEQFLGHVNNAHCAFPYVHALCDGFGFPSILSYLDGYLSYRRQGDAQPHFVKESSLSYVRQQGDAALQAHGDYRTDGKGYIHECTRRVLYTYIHPYTKERRHGVVPVESGNVLMSYYGDAWVCDLTIEDANHYITKCGLINKNSHISQDEATEYPSPAGLLKMISTMRNANGVPCSMRVTGNPGGIGHVWVKQRYIEQAPPYSPFVDHESGLKRLFIPSKMSDNQILLENDPNYRGRVVASTYGNEALRKAWLEGDWDIVAGAFFEIWDKRRHVIKPFTIPSGWNRFISGDWGSARPFSFGWWAIVDDDYKTQEGLVLPRGCLVRYQEWYGMARNESGQPLYNTGLKLDAETVGSGINQRSAGQKIGLSVIDPACFNSDGGPSIAERLHKGAGNILFRRADNKRVSKIGSIGGWDAMRSRLLGEGEDRPMVVCFDNCLDSIRTIPALQHDKDRIEDVDTEGEDHAPDEWRYACMSRPWTNVKKEAQKTRYWEDMTLDELWKQTGLKNKRL